jgi:hypothetical protein
VVFITRLENGRQINDGLCLKCAKELGIKPVEDMMQKMGISDEDLDGLTNEMMAAFGGAEGMEGLVPQNDEDDGEDEDGKTATFPFLISFSAARLRRSRRRAEPAARRSRSASPPKSAASGNSSRATAFRSPAARRRGSWTTSSAVRRNCNRVVQILITPPEKQSMPHRRPGVGKDGHCRGPGTCASATARCPTSCATRRSICST